jgi:hypothetical protein
LRESITASKPVQQALRVLRKTQHQRQSQQRQPHYQRREQQA